MSKYKFSRNHLIFVLSVFVLVSIISAFICLNSSNYIARAMDNGYVVDVNEDFENDNVLVVLNSTVSEVNKIYEPNFFSGVEVDSIKDLTARTNPANKGGNDFKQILQIYLKDKSKESVLKAIDLLNKIDGIESAEPNYICKTGSVANDDYYEEQWGLNGSYGVNINDTWDISVGSRTVRVGVIDTGVSPHEDLNDNLAAGWNFLDNNSDTEDFSGHGTHVAGIIGAVGDNNQGVSGINKKVSIVPLKVSYDGSMPTSAVVEAINYAQNLWGTTNQIDILNLSSWGYPNDNDLFTAIDNYQGLFVCIAGNASKNIDNSPNYPGSYNIDNLITVGSTKKDGSRSSISNYGKTSVDLFAPGEYILSTYPVSLCESGTCKQSSHYANGYHSLSGTSMAAPHVAGVAALLLSVDNNLTSAELKQIICDSVVKDSRLSGLCVTGGRLSAYNALNRSGYTLNLVNGANLTQEKEFNNGDEISIITVPTKNHYEFEGYYTGENGTGTKYIGAKVEYNGYNYGLYPDNLGLRWYGSSDLTLYANWTPLKMDYSYKVYVEGEGTLPDGTITIESGAATKLTAPKIEGYTFSKWIANNENLTDGSSYTFQLYRSYVTGEITIYRYGSSSPENSDGYLYAYYTKDTCVAEGTLITLADGSLKPVEQLTGDEQLLVWNLKTGSFDYAPILFIDCDSSAYYNVINLYFSDGTNVKVISEHAFWDIDLNKYVTLDYGAEQYVGHWFNKQTTNEDGALAWTQVQLTSVEIREEYTSAWSPVTYGHLCYYVNGMLSMPGGIEGLYNIFEVDAQSMKFDEAAYEADIQTYGLFTYEEFCELYNIPEAMFEACGGQYLKVAIGKGVLDYSNLEILVDRYSAFFVN